LREIVIVFTGSDVRATSSEASSAETSYYRCHSQINPEPGRFSEFFSGRTNLGHNLFSQGLSAISKQTGPCPRASAM
jgi:hypothetical protein